MKSTFTFTFPVLERYIKTLPSTLVAAFLSVHFTRVKYSLAAFTIGFFWSAFKAIATQAVLDKLMDFNLSIATVIQLHHLLYLLAMLL